MHFANCLVSTFKFSALSTNTKHTVIRALFNFLCGYFFLILFRVKSKMHEDKQLYVFDIDNTIGDTYPTLNQTYSSEKERLLSIPVFPRIKNLLSGLLQSKSRKVIFLTSRSYLAWRTTHEWLLLNGIHAALTDVIIVSSPAQKIEFLNKILPRKRPVTFIDDLSWNHEKGEVKFYSSEIELISGLPLRYVGYNTIKRFNSKTKK